MKELLQELTALPPYVLGWVCGIVVNVSVFLRAAFIAGYRSGRGKA